MECGVGFVYSSERMCQRTSHWPLTEQEGEAGLLALRRSSLVIAVGEQGFGGWLESVLWGIPN